MKESEINSRIEETLGAFDALGEIKTSPEWNRLLMARLATPGRTAFKEVVTSRFAVMLAIILLINIGVLLNIIIGPKHNTAYRNLELKSISQDFLINPISLNN
jgi:hypothetical protein